MNSPDKPHFKILCLHGVATNKEFMKLQMKEFMSVFNYCEFHFIEGTIEVAASIARDQRALKYMPDKKIYSWDSTQLNTGLEEGFGFDKSIDYICDFINQNGPFDGFIGFSQGAATIQYFLELYQYGQLKDKIKTQNYVPKFVILVAVSPHYRFLKSQKPLKTDNTTTITTNQPKMFFNPNQMEKIYKIPSLHIIGKSDYIFPICLLTTTVFPRPIVIFHDEGHKFPKLSMEMINTIDSFLKAQSYQKEKGINDINTRVIQATPKLQKPLRISNIYRESLNSIF